VPTPPPEGHGRKISLWCEPDEHTCLLRALASKQVVARDAGSRRDLQSGSAQALSVMRSDVNYECYYSGVCDVFLLFFFFDL
jgi:hypothetical protein